MTRRHPRPRTRPVSARGLTLVELMLAVTITAMIGAAVAAMLAAVSYGTDSSKDIRSLVARNKAVSARITASIRSSVQVLEQGDGFIILWMDDTDENGEPNLLEIRRINLDGATNQLSSYVAPDDATDVEYVLTDDFETITDALMGTADFPQELWATGVEGWLIALDEADPQASSLVSYQITLASNDMNDIAIAAVSLRN